MYVGFASLLLVTLLISGCSSSDPLVPTLSRFPAEALADTLDPLPAWDYSAFRVRAEREIQNGALAARMESIGVDSVRLLAGHAEEDPRPLRLDNALLWVRLRTSGGAAAWGLVSLFRHPQQDSTWHANQPTDSPYRASRVYASAPGNVEVYAFVQSGAWSFVGAPGFRLLST